MYVLYIYVLYIIYIYILYTNIIHTYTKYILKHVNMFIYINKDMYLEKILKCFYN